MSGSNSSAPAGAAADSTLTPLQLHRALAARADAATPTPAPHRARPLQMLLVLLVCAAPVIASYFTYFVRPARRRARNYGELIAPPRPMPAALPLADLRRRTRSRRSRCTASGCSSSSPAAPATRVCERHLWLQRQLRETLGRETDRVDKLWLVDDDAPPRAETLQRSAPPAAPRADAGAARRRAAALAAWLAAGGRAARSRTISTSSIRCGDWMMRVPADADPAQAEARPRDAAARLGLAGTGRADER